MNLSRRSLLKGLAKAIVAYQAAPLIKALQAVPPAQLTYLSFNQLLNDYLSADLLRAELMKENFLMQRINKEVSWKGSSIPLPFKV